MIRTAASPSLYLTSNSGAVPRRADSPAGFARYFLGRRLRGSISPAAVDSITAAIEKQEGVYSGSVAYRNNNPGNLVYAGQPGAVRGAGGFAQFPTMAAGEQALKNQIVLDASRGSDVNGHPINTLSDLIGSWAPPSENDTAAYIASVSASTGYDPSAPLSSLGAGDSFSFSLPDSSITDQLQASVDLSSIGLTSSVPAYAVGVAGLVALLLVTRL